MTRNKLLMSIASVAIIAAAPTLAKPGGGAGGGMGNMGAQGPMNTTGQTMRDMGRMNSQGPANANQNAIDRANSNSVLSTTTDDPGSTTRIRGQDRVRDKASTNATNRRAKSQGAAHANIQGLTHASPNSALAGAGVTTLTGLTTGLTVNNSGGTAIGTVDQVITNRAGAVVGIRVTLTDGSTVIIPATTLSMNGTTVITSSTQF